VVIHDDTLDRTTDGKGPVAAQDWSALSTLVLKATGGQRLLLLDEVIEIFRPTPIVMRPEVKAGPDRVPYPGHAARVARALEQARVLQRCVITAAHVPPCAQRGEASAGATCRATCRRSGSWC
jgi:glycerophosphoryl diester phosphodiesterase